MTGAAFINSALRLLGIKQPGETPTAAELTDGLVVLNDMLEAWNIDPSMVYSIPRATHPLVALTSSYTMGSGGAINVARPARIVRWGVVNAGVESPLLVLSDKQWAEVANKSASSAVPTKLYDNGSFPLRTIYLNPVPSSAGLILVYYSWATLSTFAATSTDNSYPPAYTKAIRYNLAVGLAMEYGTATPADVAAVAIQTKQAIQQLNQLRGPMEITNPSTVVQGAAIPPNTIPIQVPGAS